MNTAFASAALLEAGSAVGKTASLGITAISVAIILISVFYGMSRGMYKTAIRIVTIAISVLLSYYVVKRITAYAHTLFVGRSVEGVITNFWTGYINLFNEKVRGIINSFDAPTVERILATVFVICAVPIIFICVFHLIKLLTLALYLIGHGIFRVGKAKSPVSMIMGCILGAIQGLMIVWATMMPIAGVAAIAKDARSTLISDKDPAVAQNITSAYENYIDDICANPFIKLVDGFGGDIMFSRMMTVKVGDESVNMKKEAVVLAEVVADAYPMMDGGFSWAELRDKDKHAMTSVLDDVGNDKYTAKTVAGILRGISNAHKTGYFNFGFQEPFKSFMDEFIQVFDDSDETNVKGDLKTFLDVYFILNDAEVLSYFGGGLTEDTAEALLAAKDGETKVITKVTDKLSENDRTAGLVTSLTKFSLKLMAETSGNILPEGADADKIYDDVKVGMVDVLANVNDPTIPAEEKRDAVKESLNTTLINSGVVSAEKPLAEEQMNSITDYVMENYQGKTELTDDDINNAILAYYDKQGTTPPEGGVPVLPEGSEPVIPEGGEPVIPEGSEPVIPEGGIVEG